MNIFSFSLPCVFILFPKACFFFYFLLFPYFGFICIFMIFILAAVPKCFYAQDCDSWSILFPFYYFPSFLLTRTHSSLSIAIACSYVFSTNIGTKLQLSLVKTLWEMLCSWVLCNGQCVLKKNIWGGKIYKVVWYCGSSSYVTAIPPIEKAHARPFVCFSLNIIPMISLPDTWLYFPLILQL